VHGTGAYVSPRRRQSTTYPATRRPSCAHHIFNRGEVDGLHVAWSGNTVYRVERLLSRVVAADGSAAPMSYVSRRRRTTGRARSGSAGSTQADGTGSPT
jgi:hypothetical protein